MATFWHKRVFSSVTAVTYLCDEKSFSFFDASIQLGSATPAHNAK